MLILLHRRIHTLLCAMIAFSALFACSCASTGQGAKRGYSFDDAEGGLIIFSGVPSKDCFGMEMIVLKFTDVSTGKLAGDHIIKNMFIKNDFENPPGILQIQEYKPGHYTFYNVLAVDGTKRIWGKHSYNAEFELKDDEIVYLGEFSVDINRSEKSLSVLVTDRQERDLEIFDERMDNFRAKDVKIRILEPTLRNGD